VHGLFADAPGHVAEARAGDGLALDVLALVLEDLLQIVHGAVAGGLRAGQAAAVGKALAGEHAVFPHALETAVLAEQIADLAAAHAHVAGGNVAVRPDVAVQGRHEALAETHDLGVGFAGRIEVRAALAAADGQAGQGVLEDLLEAQELDDAGIDVRLEAQAALVRADRTVELAAVTDIGMILALVIHPYDAEREHPFRLDHPVQQVGFHIFGMCVDYGGDGREHFFNGLDKFRLIAVLFLHILNDTGDISIHFGKSSSKTCYLLDNPCADCLKIIITYSWAKYNPENQAWKLVIMSTISAPMRFWASTVAAPMCGVQETIGWL